MAMILVPGAFGLIESIPTKLAKVPKAEQFTSHVLASIAKSQPALPFVQLEPHTNVKKTV
jgi:hypothetical protein